MPFKPIFSFILLSLFFCSCEDVVQIKLDEGSNVYVIDAFMQNGHAGQWIRIRYNSAYFSNQKPEPVTNAKVKLYDLEAGVSYPFYHSEDGKYQVFTGKDNFATVNHQYKLEVIIDGVTYSALTRLARGAKIDSIGKNYYDNDILGRNMEPYYLCTLWVKDKADDIADYYWIKETSSDSTYINVCIDGTSGIVKNAPADSMHFTTPYNLMGFRRYWPGAYCNVEVHGVTKETYHFLVQARDQITNGGMFAKTPENVKTNFVTPADAKIKAVGWFSIATFDKVSQQMPY